MSANVFARVTALQRRFNVEFHCRQSVGRLQTALYCYPAFVRRHRTSPSVRDPHETEVGWDNE